MPLFRAGLFLDLIAFMADAAVAVLLYAILRGAGRTVALVAAAFRLVAHPAIGSLNLLAHWAAAVLLGGTASAASLGAGEAQALAYTALELHGAGYLIAGAFFGVHMLLLGVLLVRSTHFPDWLGYLVTLAGVAYLVETTTFFVVPGLASVGATFVVFAASVAELTLCGWLIVRGRRPSRQGGEGGGAALRQRGFARRVASASRGFSGQ